jgi:enoyl-[acyl-carrier protein] reductase II
MVIETTITRMFGIKHPIFGAPMAPFYTTELTIAVSEAGGLGTLSHTFLTGKGTLTELKNNMLQVIEHTDKPFGFNVRTARTQLDAPSLCRKAPKFIMSNPKLREQCKYFLTSAGSPKVLEKSRSYQKLKESNPDVKHFHVSPALWLADKSIEAGVDGLVITGSEGGGHQSYEQVTTLVLLQQVLQKYPDVPIIACGGFANGIGLASAIAAGAGAISMGSRFISSQESEFHENYKNIVPPAQASDTTLVTGSLAPIRLWKNNYTAHHGLVASREEKIAEEQEKDIQMLIDEVVAYEIVYTEGDIFDGAVPLGQSIGAINSIESVPIIIDEIVSTAEKLLNSAASKIK